MAEKSEGPGSAAGFVPIGPAGPLTARGWKIYGERNKKHTPLERACVCEWACFSSSTCCWSCTSLDVELATSPWRIAAASWRACCSNLEVETIGHAELISVGLVSYHVYMKSHTTLEHDNQDKAAHKPVGPFPQSLLACTSIHPRVANAWSFSKSLTRSWYRLLAAASSYNQIEMPKRDSFRWWQYRSRCLVEMGGQCTRLYYSNKIRAVI